MKEQQKEYLLSVSVRLWTPADGDTVSISEDMPIKVMDYTAMLDVLNRFHQLAAQIRAEQS